MAAPLQLEARLIRSDILCELRQLHIARAALVKDRTATKNRAKAVTHCLLKRPAPEADQEAGPTIEAEIAARIQAEPDLARRFDILTSIPGVARLTALVLLIEMPELGRLKAECSYEHSSVRHGSRLAARRFP